MTKKKQISVPEKLAELSKTCDFIWGFHPTDDVLVLSFPRIQIFVPCEELKDPYLDTVGMYQKLSREARQKMELQLDILNFVLEKAVEE